MSNIHDGRYYTDLEDPILPSECTEHWLQFIKPDDKIYRNSIYTGKWMLFLPDLNEHDRQWPLLKQALNDGLLGISMKASTSISTRRDDSLTCIYTKDFRDIEDVKRVLVSLRNMGYLESVLPPSDWTEFCQSLVNIGLLRLLLPPLAFKLRWSEIAQRGVNPLLHVNLIKKPP